MKLKIFAFLILFSTLMAAKGAVLTWTNTAGGGWQTASNWDLHQVPTAGDIAMITAPGDYAVTIANNVTVSQLTLGGLSGTQTLTLTSSTLTVTNAGLITAHGVLDMQGGTLSGVM